jgi:uncharacterized membrane protein (UPF0136 family)
MLFFGLFLEFIMQLSAILAWYSLEFWIPFKLTLGLIMEVTAIISILLSSLYGSKSRIDTNNLPKHMVKATIKVTINDVYLIIAMIIAIIIRCWYQRFVGGPLSDGALYMEMARNIVVHGLFTSRSIEPTLIPVYNQLGFNDHIITIFAFAVFFFLSTPDFLTAKLMTIFTGVLVVYMTYKLSSELFRREVSLMALAISTIHPMLVFFSCAILGPEILGTLFLVSTLFFLILGFKYKNKVYIYGILAGITIFLLLGTEYPFFFLFLITLPFFVLIMNRSNRCLAFFYSVLSVLGLLLAAFFFPRTEQFFLNPPTPEFVIGYVTVQLFVVAAYFMLKNRTNGIKLIGISSIICLLLVQLAMLRCYYVALYMPLDKVIYSKANTFPITAVYNQFVLTILIRIKEYMNVLMTTGRVFVSATNIVIACLAVLSFINLKDLNQKMVLIMYPVVFVLAQGFAWPWSILGTSVWDYRFHVSTIPFMVLLAASCLEPLVSQRTINVDSVKGTVFFQEIPTGVKIFIVFLMLSGIFFPIYHSYTYYLYRENVKFSMWQDAVEWIKENVPINATLITRTPREFSWLTSRPCVIPVNQEKWSTAKYDVDLNLLLQLIRKYHVSFIIVDDQFYETYPKLGFLYDEASSTWGFELCYKSIHESSKLYIYNVTKILAYDLTVSILTINASSDTFVYEDNPSQNYVNYSLLYVGNGYGCSKLRAFIQFKLPNLTDTSTIVAATLRLKVSRIQLEGSMVSKLQLPIYVTYINNSVDFQNLTWNTQPNITTDYYPGITQNQVTVETGMIISWDITSILQKFKHNQTVTFCVHMDYLPLRFTNVQFASIESGFPPMIDLVIIHP